MTDLRGRNSPDDSEKTSVVLNPDGKSGFEDASGKVHKEKMELLMTNASSIPQSKVKVSTSHVPRLKKNQSTAGSKDRKILLYLCLPDSVTLKALHRITADHVRSLPANSPNHLQGRETKMNYSSAYYICGETCGEPRKMVSVG